MPKPYTAYANLTSMPKPLARRWVAALRSGKYKQGRLMLREDAEGTSNYCCLGVLCEIAGCPYSPIRQDYTMPNGELRLGSVNRNFGLTNAQEGALMAMNDSGGRSFKQIARWIERNILKEKAVRTPKPSAKPKPKAKPKAKAKPKTKRTK